MKAFRLSIPAALAVLTVNLLYLGVIIYAIYSMFGLGILIVLFIAKAIAMLTPIFHAYEVKPVEPDRHTVEE